MKEIPAPRVEYPDDGSVCPVTRFVWHPMEVAAPMPPTRRKLAGRRIAIVGGQDRTAGRITEALEQHGATIFRYVQDGGDPERISAAFKSRVGRIDGIVDLNVEGPFGPAAQNGWQDALRASVSLIKAFYEEWAQEADAARLFYMPVTCMGGDMGYSGSDIVQPLGGIWAGLAKSLPREIPNCNVKVLDLARDDYAHVDRIIVRELYEWGYVEIGYKHGVRYSLSAHKESVGQPAIGLEAGDTVLMSGGARGIGLALAKALAQNTGCRVVITGRSPLPSGAEPWASMDAAAFKGYRHEMLRATQPGKTVADTRRDLEYIAGLRELYQNMQDVRAAGLPIEYYPCDVTVPEQVEDVLARIGPRLSGVIHNAGVDTPIRLRAKSVESFVATVRVKVDGFLNILRTLQGRELKFFCNVGSVAGRMGGMVGQIDYAAGNEALTRLTFWAAQEAPFPVKILCWPTWDRLGMIANFEATLKYMSAINVDEGIYHWQRDILAAGRGEVTFIGQFGQALSHAQLRGYPPMYDMPGIERLYSQAFYLGEVTRYRPFHHSRSQNLIDARVAPCMHDFSIDGAPALPVSVLLAYALSVGEQVVPEGWAQLYLHEVRDVVIHLWALKSDGARVALEKDGMGQWLDGQWVVDVALTKTAPRGKEALAQLRLVYGREQPPAETVALPDAATGGRIHLAPMHGLSWSGFVFQPARWTRDAGGALRGDVTPCEPSDLWSMPHLPRLALPASHVENIVRAGMSLYAAREPHGRLTIARIGLASGSTAPKTIVAYTNENTWAIVDGDGRVGLRMDGIAYHEELDGFARETRGPLLSLSALSQAMAQRFHRVPQGQPG